MDAVVALNLQTEVHIISSSETKRNSTFVQPYVSDKKTAELFNILFDLVNKFSFIGGVEILRDLKHILFRLRSFFNKGSLVLKYETDTFLINSIFDNLFSFEQIKHSQYSKSNWRQLK